MKTLKEKCQEITSISTKYDSNLKKFLSDKEMNKLLEIKGDKLSEKAYNVIFEDYKDCSCGNEVTFINFSRGYRTFCSKKCQAIFRESNWSPEMKEHRSTTISKSVKAIWSNPENKEWLDERNRKVGISSKRMWDTATEEWRKNLRKKTFATNVKLGLCMCKEDKRDFELYSAVVGEFTNKNYNKYYCEINPNKLIRSYKEYHIDHKFSKLEGFKNNIPAYIIADKNNLEMLYCIDNMSKGSKCSITLEDLLSLIKPTR